MPNDTRANGKTATPFTPTLSSRFRGPKTPLTPKLAGSTASSPAVSPQHEARHAFSPSARDGTPLAGNVTPRSGARKSRIGTDSPATPVGGKTRSRRTSVREGAKPDPRDGPSPPSWGISSPSTRPGSSARPKSVVMGATTSAILTRRVSAAKSGLGNDGPIQSKFFHVDDIQATAEPTREQERPRLRVAATFVDVNGVSADGIVPTHSTPDTAKTSPRKDDRFFHASEIRINSPSNSSPGSTLSKKASSPGLRSPRLQSPELSRPSRTNPRPPSPLKTASLRSATVETTSLPKTDVTATVLPPRHTRTDSARRLSNGTSVSSTSRRGHTKSASTTSLGQVISPSTRPVMATNFTKVETCLSPRLATSSSASETLLDPISPSTLSPRSTSLASSNTAPSSLTTTSASPNLLPTTHNISTPSEPGLNKSKSITDQASNARRERKVLDLEISNSSLLAINRTLEREIHKQTVELRRFRRLSKSGRLSMLTSTTTRTASGQSSLGALAELGNEHDDDEQDSDADSNNDEDEDDITSSLSNDSLSHSRQRTRDEKRLLLDLSKHRQLLIDSEKMSASLRRCLTYTDELIREGNKALQYKVHVNDVELGGRVLVHNDDDDGEVSDGLNEMPDNSSKSLLSPDLTMAGLEEAQLWRGTGSIQQLDGKGDSPNVTVMPDR